MPQRTPALHPARALVLLAAVLVTGCATLQVDRLDRADAAYPDALELEAVPFHPQERYQCGPAALATVLNNAGVDVTPDDLVDQVYVPERRGSLQVEMRGATRRHGRVPYTLGPSMEDLLAELAAGHPVVVFQNLGLAWYPVWHYAVVVGYDLDAGEVILRSGTVERHVIAMRRFERTWRRTDYWALVIPPPGEVPATAEPQPFLSEVVQLERLERWPEAEAAYRAAVTAWPEVPAAHLGLGNALYHQDRHQEATEALRTGARRHPDAPAVRHNLAAVLAEQGAYREALDHARAAAGHDSRWRERTQRLLEEIEAALAEAS